MGNNPSKTNQVEQRTTERLFNCPKDRVKEVSTHAAQAGLATRDPPTKSIAILRSNDGTLHTQTRKTLQVLNPGITVLLAQQGSDLMYIHGARACHLVQTQGNTALEETQVVLYIKEGFEYFARAMPIKYEHQDQVTVQHKPHMVVAKIEDNYLLVLGAEIANVQQEGLRLIIEGLAKERPVILIYADVNKQLHQQLGCQEGTSIYSLDHEGGTWKVAHIDRHRQQQPNGSYSVVTNTSGTPMVVIETNRVHEDLTPQKINIYADIHTVAKECHKIYQTKELFRKITDSIERQAEPHYRCEQKTGHIPQVVKDLEQGQYKQMNARQKSETFDRLDQHARNRAISVQQDFIPKYLMGGLVDHRTNGEITCTRLESEPEGQAITGIDTVSDNRQIRLTGALATQHQLHRTLGTHHPEAKQILEKVQRYADKYPKDRMTSTDKYVLLYTAMWSVKQASTSRGIDKLTNAEFQDLLYCGQCHPKVNPSLKQWKAALEECKSPTKACKTLTRWLAHMVFEDEIKDHKNKMAPTRIITHRPMTKNVADTHKARSLMQGSAVLRLMEAVTLALLKRNGDRLEPQQKGGRKGVSADIAYEAMQHLQTGGKEAVVVQLDAQDAFDTTRIDILLEEVDKFDPDLAYMLARVHLESLVMAPSDVDDPTETTRNATVHRRVLGVQQGAIHSAAAYTMATTLLLRALPPHIKENLRLYIDDISLFTSEERAASEQALIRQKAKELGIEINEQKTKVLGSAGHRQQKARILGVTISAQGDASPTMQIMSDKLKAVLTVAQHQNMTRAETARAVINFLQTKYLPKFSPVLSQQPKQQALFWRDTMHMLEKLQPKLNGLTRQHIRLLDPTAQTWSALKTKFKMEHVGSMQTETTISDLVTNKIPAMAIHRLEAIDLAARYLAEDDFKASDALLKEVTHIMDGTMARDLKDEIDQISFHNDSISHITASTPRRRQERRQDIEGLCEIEREFRETEPEQEDESARWQRAMSTMTRPRMIVYAEDSDSEEQTSNDEPDDPGERAYPHHASPTVANSLQRTATHSPELKLNSNSNSSGKPTQIRAEQDSNYKILGAGRLLTEIEQSPGTAAPPKLQPGKPLSALNIIRCKTENLFPTGNLPALDIKSASGHLITDQEQRQQSWRQPREDLSKDITEAEHAAPQPSQDDAALGKRQRTTEKKPRAKASQKKERKPRKDKKQKLASASEDSDWRAHGLTNRTPQEQLETLRQLQLINTTAALETSVKRAQQEGRWRSLTDTDQGADHSNAIRELDRSAAKKLKQATTLLDCTVVSSTPNSPTELQRGTPGHLSATNLSPRLDEEMLRHHYGEHNSRTNNSHDTSLPQEHGANTWQTAYMHLSRLYADTLNSATSLHNQVQTTTTPAHAPAQLPPPQPPHQQHQAGHNQSGGLPGASQTSILEAVPRHAEHSHAMLPPSHARDPPRHGADVPRPLHQVALLTQLLHQQPTPQQAQAPQHSLPQHRPAQIEPELLPPHPATTSHAAHHQPPPQPQQPLHQPLPQPLAHSLAALTDTQLPLTQQYGADGLHVKGYDNDGYDANGYDRHGYDRQGTHYTRHDVHHYHASTSRDRSGDHTNRRRNRNNSKRYNDGGYSNGNRSGQYQARR
jgi:Reverse transcriptase (RNA-dependent DNA polymerase)